ncbi:MAG: glycosyltransferase [Candidatus Omnitrophica bacterium]|nr:glycosyltransferase [Candidatus Omnitrophota bacterium]
MKVLQILPSLEVGGVERGVIDLARAMKNRGEETVVISSGGPLISELEKMGIHHYQLGVHKKSVFSLALVSKIAGVIQRERVDIVHARSRVPAWLGWLAARQTGKPFITTCHGYYSPHWLSRVMGWGQCVIAISQVIGRHMIDDFGVPPDRIRLIHRGVDLSQFCFHPSHYDETPKTLRVINVARLSPIKGQLEFLRAVHLLRRRLQGVEVWLVGSEGKDRCKYTELLQKTIRQLGLESCVKLLGTRRDVAGLLAQADLLVLSTLMPEAFGRVIVEAGAVGTAVLATEVGGVLDIIDHKENGWLVSPGDIEGMSDAMHQMLMDRDLCKQYALRLRQKIEMKFTVEQMVEKTLGVYHEVLCKKKILVIKLGAAGDVILAVPSLRMLRHRFPESSIRLVVDKKLACLVSRAPYLDEVIPVNRKKLSNLFYLLKVAKKLRKECCDISVDFQNTKWTHLLSYLSNVRERYGFARGELGFLLNRPDRSFDIHDSPIKHQFRILSKLGVTQLDEDLELWVEPEAEQRMRKVLGCRNGSAQDPKWVGLVIGSSPKWPTKRWPLDSFQELSRLLIQKAGCRIVLIGTQEESDDLAGFDSFPKDRMINLVGKTSLEDLIVLVKLLDVLVTGDTAPLHIASAVKTKIVALFGPTDPRRYMPPAESAVVLTRYLACQPCHRGKCPLEEERVCLKRISVNDVFEAVQKQLGIESHIGLKISPPL